MYYPKLNSRQFLRSNQWKECVKQSRSMSALHLRVPQNSAQCSTQTVRPYGYHIHPVSPVHYAYASAQTFCWISHVARSHKAYNQIFKNGELIFLNAKRFGVGVYTAQITFLITVTKLNRVASLRRATGLNVQYQCLK